MVGEGKGYHLHSAEHSFNRMKGYKVGKVMGEFKRGELRSSSGKLVTNPKQALAIGLSEQRKLEKGKYLGNPKGIKQSLWIPKSAIGDYDDGTKKGKRGLRLYYEHLLENNPEDSVYPKKLRDYHKSVVAELSK